MAASPPLPTTRLRQICTTACDAAVAQASTYDHVQTAAWNQSIINSILQSLMSESAVGDEPPAYKFIVSATIIQHLSDPRGGAVEGGEKKEKVGRRGMNSATGAFWNNEKDGMWSYKYGGGEGKGMDIVVSVMWVAV